MDKNLQDNFLSLVRLGIGHSVSIPCETFDWQALQALAMELGLYAIALDGVEKLSLSSRPPQDLLLEWIGEVLQSYEYQYKQYCKAIAEMAGFYNSHGYKMMVLKGYACSLNWPKPEHRPCGDIDVWLFGKQKEADAIIARDKGIVVDCSHHHHTVFTWGEFMVENHFDFINVHHHKSHVALEKTLKELGADDSHFVEVSGEKVYLPSADLHALFLLKHAALHFVGTELTFRQVLDWAFFVEKHGKNIDWDWLKGVLDENGMMPFFNIVNAICVEDLGFDAGIFPSVQFLPLQKDRVLNEIFTYKYEDDLTLNFFMRQVHRFQRWNGNGWKHELCYKESMWSAFWSGVWGHLLKPASI